MTDRTTIFFSVTAISPADGLRGTISMTMTVQEVMEQSIITRKCSAVIGAVEGRIKEPGWMYYCICCLQDGISLNSVPAITYRLKVELRAS